MSSPRRLAVVAVVAVFALVVSQASDSSSGDPDVRMVVGDALGLREGSDVRVGGVPVGRVSATELTSGDRVRIDLDITDPSVHIGRDPSVTVKAVNLLGERYASLDPGRGASETAAPGLRVIPASRVTRSVDLDQVLDVLDGDTRARLAVLINEVGAATAGRGADLATLLDRLPPTLSATDRLLRELTADNGALGRLVTTTDGFLARITGERRALGRLVDSAAGAAATFSGRSEQLRATVRRGPAALTQLRGLLAELHRTVGPLETAAGRLSASAKPLVSTLRAAEPFRRAAAPVLTKALDTAPALSRLARGATPVLRRSAPTLAALESFSSSARPLTQTLGAATPDILGVLEGWGRAIQGRDGRGHAFHGGVTLGRNLVDSLFGTLRAPARRRTKHQQPAGQTTTEHPATPKREDRPKLPLLDNVPDRLKEAIDGVTKAIDGLLSPRTPDDSAKDSSLVPLLDYLIGR